MTPEGAMAAYVALVGEGKGAGGGGVIPSTEEEAAVAVAAVVLDGQISSPSPRQQPPPSGKRPRPRPPASLTHHAPARPFGDWVEGLSTSSSLAPWALHPRKRLGLRGLFVWLRVRSWLVVVLLALVILMGRALLDDIHTSINQPYTKTPQNPHFSPSTARSAPRPPRAAAGRG
jgi:hypothetical protein